MKAGCLDMFDNKLKTFELPQLQEDKIEDAYNEIELLGFPVTLNHFNLIKTNYRGNVNILELAQHEGKTVRVVGNFVTLKPMRTKNGKSMAFGTFLDEHDHSWTQFISLLLYIPLP